MIGYVLAGAPTSITDGITNDTGRSVLVFESSQCNDIVRSFINAFLTGLGFGSL